MASFRAGSVWIPRITLVSIFLVTGTLPFAARLGELGPIIMGVVPFFIGAVGFFRAMALSRLGLAVSNALAGILAVPLFIVLVTLLGGP